MPKNTNQRGAVSMLTVIFLALLLTIITTSFVRISVTEQRQAIDDDLTTRAFYAAESGIEDAKRAIALFQDGQPVSLNETTCQPADVVSDGVLSADLEAEYTCQLIDLSPANFQAELGAWEGVTIPLNSDGAAFNAVQIDWHIHNSGAPYARRSSTDLPPVPAWTSSNYPAMLRAGVFSHPGGSFTSNDVSQSVMFINPASSSGTANLANDGEVVNGSCQDPPAEGQYACRMRISGISNAGNFYLRLQSLYRATNVQVTLFDGASTVPLEDVQALVDVTARAGDVFRRVEARVSLIGDDFPLPDIALWSNTDICKAFTVTNDPADYTDNRCPWQP